LLDPQILRSIDRILRYLNASLSQIWINTHISSETIVSPYVQSHRRSPRPPNYAKDLGKKGTTSDITFYNLKRGEATVTFVEPTRYPENLSSLFYAVSLSDRVIRVVDELSATFGECVLMLQCA
jgi:hypothetical protein